MKHLKTILLILTLNILILTACGTNQDAFLLDERTSVGESENYSDSSAQEKNAGSDKQTSDSSEVEQDSSLANISVYVCGSVKNPGVYTLNSAARVCDAIQAAGGVSASADEEMLNQAAPAEDGSRIYVPSKKETADQDRTSGEASSSGVSSTADSSNSTSASSSAKVNINSAGKEELMTLSGIGESKAQSIIDYRQQNGSFKSIEDIMNISGIKEGVFSKIKDQITI